MTDLRDPIRAVLRAVPGLTLREGALNLLALLGYSSERTVTLESSNPDTFLSYIMGTAAGERFSVEKARFKEWKSADLLFQLTDDELSGHMSLFKDERLNPGLMRSYLFFAIELSGDNHTRGTLTTIARQINRVFPMPVMVLIKHQAEKRQVLSIAVINRRHNRNDDAKDVLGKVTIIRDIALSEPHRGHLDILASFAIDNLVHPNRESINNFDSLHAAWEEVFNVELLNKRFYRELANWYFWALPQIEYPSDTEQNADKRRATSTIRLLTRLIFTWFLKEKGLVPDKLFNEADLGGILKDLAPDQSTYYQAILQNLFFATLNQRMGKDKDGAPFRRFALNEGLPKNKATYGIDTLYRYEEHFQGSPEAALEHFADVPFLNGGLFECLDRLEEGSNRKQYVDGFSRRTEKRPRVPNALFFAAEHPVDLSEEYGEPRRRNEKVRGLIHILHSYKFTVVENTPIDQEIALDPELLGKVFESLLASYNEETKTTARKQTGSFYTPRPIVAYMVDEALKTHLVNALSASGMPESDAATGLTVLFEYTEQEHPFLDAEVDTLLAAIHSCRILDPACGSGAFPMGVLQKLVYIIQKLDPDNGKWKQLQIADAEKGIRDLSARALAVAAIENDFNENDGDYGRKLYLIENCLYGVDIQPIAIQISKLRFFISLVCDQRTNRDKAKNHGIRPLPNLETKFVAADTLIGLPVMDQSPLVSPRVHDIEVEMERLYHSHFTIQRRDQKIKLQDKLRALRKELGGLLASSFVSPAKSRHVAEWDPFDPQASSDFFDPHWMFGRALADGFDVVIGNPPYIQIQKFAASQKALWVDQEFETYAATADIYCLFYERGVQLLREGGQLCYITSNKWLRASYGEKLRQFLGTEVHTRSVLDFGMAQNFGAATTYTCIVQCARERPEGGTWACYVQDDVAAMQDPRAYFATNGVRQEQLGGEPWVVISKERQEIKSLVEAQGIPLEDWDINIYRGILTGLNEAFYITQEQRNAFVAEDHRCEELLVQLVRGRAIERYRINWDGAWMIATFPVLGLVESRIPKPILRHLKAFRKQLEPKPAGWGARKWEGRKAGSYKWFETQDAIAYRGEFAKPKIMYPNMTKYLPFYLDKGAGYFTNDKGFVITATNPSLAYLTAFLNSSVFRASFRDTFPELLGNTYEVRKIFMEKIPVRKPSTEEMRLFDVLVSAVQLSKAYGDESTGAFFEDLVDACVMECYFREHMEARDLLFQGILTPYLVDCDSKATDAQQRAWVLRFYQEMNSPDHPVRNRLLRLTADSPDLLAVIKAEGRV